MKVGAEDRNKLIAAGSFGVLALGYLVYTVFGGSGSDAPTSATAPLVTTVRVPTSGQTSPTTRAIHSSLDPTLHPEGMLLAESLVYAGSGRNIFLAPGALSPQAAAVKIPKLEASPRFIATAPVSTGPPPPPAIDLRFFGTSTNGQGKRQAFLLRGEDVLIASQGDVVNRHYRVGAITAITVEITDLSNNNMQRLPITAQ